MLKWEEISECGKENCYASVDGNGRSIFCTRFPDGLYHCETRYTGGAELVVHPKAYQTLKGAQQFFEHKENLRSEKSAR